MRAISAWPISSALGRDGIEAALNADIRTVGGHQVLTAITPLLTTAITPPVITIVLGGHTVRVGE